MKIGSQVFSRVYIENQHTVSLLLELIQDFTHTTIIFNPAGLEQAYVTKIGITALLNELQI